MVLELLNCGMLEAVTSNKYTAQRATLLTKHGLMVQGVPSVGGFLAGFALAVK